MKFRPDLPDHASPPGIEVVQLTTEPDVPGSHVYMEAPIFTPDSKRLVLHRSAHAHGSDKNDPQHRYLLCDLDNGCALSPLTEETGATAPAVTPDGRFLYYFVDETELGGGRLTLKRVGLEGQGRETVLALDAPIPGTKLCPSRIYMLATMSSDGRRIALSAFLGDGRNAAAHGGLMVFDLEKATVEVIIAGPNWCNMHAQYCRSTDPVAMRDIMIQESHNLMWDSQGQLISSETDPTRQGAPQLRGERLWGELTLPQKANGGPGMDIHVIRDDGTDFRTMPWGRDGNEHPHGHQCWRGRTSWAVSVNNLTVPRESQLTESTASTDAGHLGKQTPGGVRNDLSREFPQPLFKHCGIDSEGTRLIADSEPEDQGGRIFLAEMGVPGRDPLRNWRYLLNPRSSCVKDAHIHPFLSPDGSMAFFNSDESGLLQAYMARGL